MNERIRELARMSGFNLDETGSFSEFAENTRLDCFAKLIIEETLDQVKERAYYTGDRDWSDEVDRQWIQLEFGYGKLHDAKRSGVK